MIDSKIYRKPERKALLIQRSSQEKAENEEFISEKTGTSARVTEEGWGQNESRTAPTIVPTGSKVPPANPQAPPEVVTSAGKLTESAILILHEITGVDEPTLRGADIRMKQKAGDLPWYNPNNGGGAITLGNTITFTWNYYDSSNSYHFRKKGVTYYTSLGNDIYAWLSLLSHEVGHLPQAKEFGTDKKGVSKYKGFFVGQYIRYMSHDKVPFEVAAEEGHYVFLNLIGGYRSKTSTGQSLLGIMRSSQTDVQKRAAIQALLQNPTVMQQIQQLRQAYRTSHARKYKRTSKQLKRAAKKRIKRTGK